MTVRLRNKNSGVVIAVPDDAAAAFRKRGYTLVRGDTKPARKPASKPVVEAAADTAADDTAAE